MRWTMAWIAVVLGLAGIAGASAYWRYQEDQRLAVVEARRTLDDRLAVRGLEAGQPVFIRIFKEEAALEVWMQAPRGWALFQTYPICRYSGRLGPKLKTGDRQAPEGFYDISLRQLNPNSRHHLAFNLGFPNAFDRAHGRTGSYLMVHGGCTSAGCYAMTDAGVDDIYKLVRAALQNGRESVAVHAFPFRMSPDNMSRHMSSRWIDFWRELERGYDAFEARRAVPQVRVEGRRYVVTG